MHILINPFKGKNQISKSIFFILNNLIIFLHNCIIIYTFALIIYQLNKITMIKNYVKTISFFFISLFIISCEDPIVTNAEIALAVNPDTIYISDRDSFQTVYISTKPKGTVSYTIAQTPKWLTLDKKEGQLSGKIESLTLKPVSSGLNEGIYKGKIGIISDIAGTKDIVVFLSVNSHPKIKTSATTLDFSAETNSIDFTIENIGTGILQWNIDSMPEWINFSTKSGVLLKGQKSTIKANCNRIGKNADTYNSSFTIKSNSEIDISPINVQMVVAKISDMKISKDSLIFDYFSTTKEFYVKNTGNDVLDWTSTEVSSFTLSPKSGSVAIGDSVKVVATINRLNMKNGVTFSSISVQGNSGKTFVLPIRVNNYVNSKWLLDFNILDAEYSKATDKVITISTNPDKLTIIDPDSRTATHISLNIAAKTVSVNKAGTFAAVGHNGFVTLVNLATLKIEKEYSVPCDVLDIVLTSNNWAYLFPVRDQWTNIKCLNANTGLTTTQTGYSIYAGTVGRLHPSEKYIYGADNGVSPSDIEKYDISNGTSAYLYDSPYHGDYAMGGNLWFSEDGERIFTKGKTVLKSSTDKANDMVYNGSLATTNYIRTLYHSAAKNKVYAIEQMAYNWSTEQMSSEIYVFNYSYLNFIEKLSLEKFMTPYGVEGGKLSNAEGYFVFAKSDGSKVYALVKAQAGSGLLNDWAIQSINQ